MAPPAQGRTSENELLRVLHPEGRGIVGDRTIVKPFPEGIDDWSHFSFETVRLCRSRRTSYLRIRHSNTVQNIVDLRSF